MPKMWYEKILEEISETNADILFVIDPVNLLENSDIQLSLEKVYNIVEFQNELGLRKILRSLNDKTIFKFMEQSQIPYDLFSSHATIEIAPSVVFPLLNNDLLCKVPLSYYQQIFEKYESEKGSIYDRLSIKDSENFIDSLIYKDDFQEKENALVLFGKLKELVEDREILYQNDWGEISKLYGELKYLINIGNLNLDLKSIEDIIQIKFKEFISNQYQDMIFDSQSPLNSNIINLIFNSTPTAIICFDCMGFEEWNIIKNHLKRKSIDCFDENYSFSMIPSDTIFSRKALFSGLLPVKLDELGINNQTEDKLFKECLKGNFNISDGDIYFQRCSNPRDVPENYAFEDFKAVGIIFSFIDEFVHGKNINKILVSNLIEKFLEQNNPANLIRSLLEKGFRVFFTSDHGNIFATGNGVRPPKDLFNSRSRRYLKSEHKNIAEEYLTNDCIFIQFKDMIGEDYLLLLSNNTMFNTKGKSGLTHGGISVEEVVIPFIEVKKE